MLFPGSPPRKRSAEPRGLADVRAKSVFNREAERKHRPLRGTRNTSLAYSLEGVAAWDLRLLFFQRVYYRQMMLYVLGRSLLFAMRGRLVGWGKTGTQGFSNPNGLTGMVNRKTTPGVGRRITAGRGKLWTGRRQGCSGQIIPNKNYPPYQRRYGGTNHSRK